MDLLGEIVEKDPDTTIVENTPPANGQDDLSIQLTGFPKLLQKKEMSSWKQRLQQKKKKQREEKLKGAELDKSIGNATTTQNDQAKEPLTEAEEIHLENIKYMMTLSEEQILQERKELMDNLNPAVLQNLLKKIDKSAKPKSAQNTQENGNDIPLYAEIDTNKYWVGGSSKDKNMDKLDDTEIIKQLNINEDSKSKENIIEEQIEEELEFGADHFDDEALAPQEYQFIQQMDHMTNEELLNDVHFIKPHGKSGADDIQKYEPLSIDDPKFDEKLKKTYFPDLPTEINKLQWMQKDESLDNESQRKVETIDNVAEIRFDFKGNMIPLTREISTTKDGLHHHSENQHLKGYNLEELATYARSSFPSQKCIALQTLGRILYKLGKQKYYQLIPEVDVEQFEALGGSVNSITYHIYKMFWDWIAHLHIVEIIEMSLSSKNLSVKNYATDAIWLYKQGGGEPPKPENQTSDTTKEGPR
ncbi:hypothetical protein ACO0QE_002289 [Hanseniaspora vineae]